MDGMLNQFRSAVRWIPVAERLPETDDFVLVIATGSAGNVHLDQAIEFASYTKEDGWILEMWPEMENAVITFWMPVPDRPEQGKPEPVLVEVPCKIGDDIWWIDDEAPFVKCDKGGVKGIAILPEGIRVINSDGEFEEIGTRYCYLSKEAAEKALETGSY